MNIPKLSFDSRINSYNVLNNLSSYLLCMIQQEHFFYANRTGHGEQTFILRPPP